MPKQPPHFPSFPNIVLPRGGSRFFACLAFSSARFLSFLGLLPEITRIKTMNRRLMSGRESRTMNLSPVARKKKQGEEKYSAPPQTKQALEKDFAVTLAGSLFGLNYLQEIIPVVIICSSVLGGFNF